MLIEVDVQGSVSIYIVLGAPVSPGYIAPSEQHRPDQCRFSLQLHNMISIEIPKSHKKRLTIQRNKETAHAVVASDLVSRC